MKPLKVTVADANLLPSGEFERGLPAGAMVSWHLRFNEDVLMAHFRDADVNAGARFTAAMGSAATKLRLVHVASAGFDGIAARTLPVGALCANTFHHEASIARDGAVRGAAGALHRRGGLGRLVQYFSTGFHGRPATHRFGPANVLMTPHISGATRQTFEGRVGDIVANIRRLANDEPIANVVIAR